MITRPLDLASKLRPEPRNFDWLFFVNAGLIALFFSQFCSKFVLAPSVGVDFRLPRIAGADTEARATTHYVRVTNSGQIFVPAGSLTLEQFRAWTRDQAKTTAEPVLLVQASSDVPVLLLSELLTAARDGGFKNVVVAAEAPNSSGAGGEGAR